MWIPLLLCGVAFDEVWFSLSVKWWWWEKFVCHMTDVNSTWNNACQVWPYGVNSVNITYLYAYENSSVGKNSVMTFQSLAYPTLLFWDGHHKLLLVQRLCFLLTGYWKIEVNYYHLIGLLCRCCETQILMGPALYKHCKCPLCCHYYQWSYEDHEGTAYFEF